MYVILCVLRVVVERMLYRFSCPITEQCLKLDNGGTGLIIVSYDIIIPPPPLDMKDVSATLSSGRYILSYPRG